MEWFEGGRTGVLKNPFENASRDVWGGVRLLELARHGVGSGVAWFQCALVGVNYLQNN